GSAKFCTGLMIRLSSVSEDQKRPSAMVRPRDSRVPPGLRINRDSVRRTWASISALALPLIALSSWLPMARGDDRTASPTATQQSHSSSALIRVPVVDGNDIRFSRLSTARGLSQTRALQIVEDNQGFIWFGTQYGLDRFDGYEYKVFAHDPARENSLSCVYIHSLFKDRSGTLWVGCDSFLDRFDSVTETFTHYQIAPSAPGQIVNAVDRISQDRTGLLWLATGKGLFRLNPETGEIKHYGHDSSNPFSLGDNQVKGTLEDSRGRFWVIDGDDLEEFDRKSGRVLLRFRSLGTKNDVSLHEDHRGVL